MAERSQGDISSYFCYFYRVTGAPLAAGRGKRLKRIFTIAFGVLAAIWLAGCALIYLEMRRPPEEFGRFMMRVPAPVVFLGFPFETMWMRARGGDIQVGSRAPDFTLLTVDKTQLFQLSALNRMQPVVLIFGSYT
ncbi:MAG TPA: hypothetical protein VKW06_07695 [Candidatus Angelobacter sp.]|nr:hypothetical protein [Candidatus Angelobacter sp.]